MVRSCGNEKPVLSATTAIRPLTKKLLSHGISAQGHEETIISDRGDDRFEPIPEGRHWARQFPFLVPGRHSRS
jgi:hypothetical protein